MAGFVLTADLMAYVGLLACWVFGLPCFFIAVLCCALVWRTILLSATFLGEGLYVGAFALRASGGFLLMRFLTIALRLDGAILRGFTFGLFLTIIFFDFIIFFFFSLTFFLTNFLFKLGFYLDRWLGRRLNNRYFSFITGFGLASIMGGLSKIGFGISSFTSSFTGGFTGCFLGGVAVTGFVSTSFSMGFGGGAITTGLRLATTSGGGAILNIAICITIFSGLTFSFLYSCVRR